MIAGFSKSYILKLGQEFPLPIHFHAVFMSAWCLLITAQAFLIRSENTRLHRMLGRVSFVLAPLILISGFYLAEMRFLVRADTVELTANLRSLFLPFSHFFLFGFFYIMAMIFRKRPDYHARYIISATLLLVPPALIRVFSNWLPSLGGVSFLDLSFIVTDLILLALILYDLRKGMLRIPYLIALPSFVSIQVMLKYAGGSELWRRIAALFVEF